MRMVRITIGLLFVAMGLLWFSQGAGLVHWPASSFMLDQRIWMLWGGLLALAGLGVIGWGMRRA